MDTTGEKRLQTTTVGPPRETTFLLEKYLTDLDYQAKFNASSFSDSHKKLFEQVIQLASTRLKARIDGDDNKR